MNRRFANFAWAASLRLTAHFFLSTEMSLKNFLKVPLRPIFEGPAVFIKKPTATTKYGVNYHRSNKAKEGTIPISFLFNWSRRTHFHFCFVV